jgi:hypothetical protein
VAQILQHQASEASVQFTNLGKYSDTWNEIIFNLFQEKRRYQYPSIYFLVQTLNLLSTNVKSEDFLAVTWHLINKRSVVVQDSRISSDTSRTVVFERQTPSFATTTTTSEAD